VCSNKLIDFFSVLEEHERRHSADSVLLRELREFIDIDFKVGRIGVLLGEFNDLGSNDLHSKVSGVFVNQSRSP
jgi:hypothetical protein